MFSYHKASEYHDKCVPTLVKQQAEADKQRQADLRPGGKPVPESVLTDAVTIDKIWKQAVRNEENGAEQWQTSWGFMAEYDSKGQKKPPKALPERVNMFSNGTVPDTNSGNYGSRLNTDLGQQMLNMELQLSTSRRKRKLGSEMVCY